MTPVSVSFEIIDQRYWILIGLLVCPNGPSIELWYWNGLMASGLNYDIGLQQSNASQYWIMILVHFDGAGIELWYVLLSANSSLGVILNVNHGFSCQIHRWPSGSASPSHQMGLVGNLQSLFPTSVPLTFFTLPMNRLLFYCRKIGPWFNFTLKCAVYCLCPRTTL